MVIQRKKRTTQNIVINVCCTKKAFYLRRNSNILKFWILDIAWILQHDTSHSHKKQISKMSMTMY